MTDLLIVLPDFDISSYTHILPSLERALVYTADLLTLEALDVAKRAQLPPAEVARLTKSIRDSLSRLLAPEDPIGNGDQATQTPVTLVSEGLLAANARNISTLDVSLDSALHGGISAGCLTEVVGESAVGKTQFLLTLLLAVQLKEPQGLGKSALYISTEAPLQTSRLHQILSTHPALAPLSQNGGPSLSRIQSTHVHDVEAQEHILRYQVPVAIPASNIGLVVIDSIAANYRAEFDKGSVQRGSEAFARRNSQVTQLGFLLRQIAQTYNVAVVVANQVADRFTSIEPSSQMLDASQMSQRPRPVNPARPITAPPAEQQQDNVEFLYESSNLLLTEDALSLDHQQCFFTGWGDDPTTIHLKTPSLGLQWTNQLSTRIALLKDPVYKERAYEAGEEKEIAGWSRQLKVVFSNSCPESSTPFEIWEGGLRNLDKTRTIEGSQ